MGRPSTSYGKKLGDPKWQKRRLEIFERDEFTCQLCGDKESTLHVHHKHYLPVYDKETNPDDWAEVSTFDEPWMAPDEALVTLCKDCHQIETEEMKQIWGIVTSALRENFTADGLWDFFIDQGLIYKLKEQKYGQQPSEIRRRERKKKQ